MPDLPEPEKPIDLSPGPAGAAPKPARAVKRADILTWVLISFVVPSIFMLLLHHRLAPDKSILDLDRKSVV